jgi:ABC-2 type transport system ATP-binding protein
MTLPPGTDTAVRAGGLRKRYGDVAALAGVDIGIRHGEVFAPLGPNGAGNTTTVEILEATATGTAARSRCWRPVWTL